MVLSRSGGGFGPPAAPVAFNPASINFNTLGTQDPLSAGGTWTNDTQATGSNTVYAEQSSLRIIAAASGGINIAAGNAAGQVNYEDSFAFLPGYSGNQRITATIYVDSGYAPSTDNHELELILGCRTSSGTGGNGEHYWLECGWSHTTGDRFMALFGTGAGSYAGAPNDFAILSPTDSGALSGKKFVDGDVWRADYVRSTNTITTYMNGTQIHTVTDSRFATLLGDGAGLATFRRTDNGQTAANRLGFRSVVIESF